MYFSCILGTIKTKVKIDRETYTSLDIGINAFDGIHNNNTIVFVRIMDINDNDPNITDSERWIFKLFHNKDVPKEMLPV